MQVAQRLAVAHLDPDHTQVAGGTGRRVYLHRLECHIERPYASHKAVEIGFHRGDIGDEKRLLQRDMRRDQRGAKPDSVVAMQLARQLTDKVMKCTVDQQREPGFHLGLPLRRRKRGYCTTCRPRPRTLAPRLENARRVASRASCSCCDRQTCSRVPFTIRSRTSSIESLITSRSRSAWAILPSASTVVRSHWTRPDQ